MSINSPVSLPPYILAPYRWMTPVLPSPEYLPSPRMRKPTMHYSTFHSTYCDLKAPNPSRVPNHHTNVSERMQRIKPAFRPFPQRTDSSRDVLHHVYGFFLAGAAHPQSPTAFCVFLLMTRPAYEVAFSVLCVVSDID